MKRQQIISELINRGYNVEETDVVKNGVTLSGIRFDFGTPVQPTVYVDRYIDDDDLDSVVDEIVETVERSQLNQPDINVSDLASAEFIFNGLRVGFQRVEDVENIVKRNRTDLEGVEEYLYVLGGRDNGGQWSYKVHPDLLKNADITLNEAWRKAYQNMSEEVVIKSMFDTFAEMMGDIPEDMLPPEEDMMYVLSNRSKTKGAASWVCQGVIKDFAEEHGVTKLVVLPSSIHEMIIVPWKDGMSMDELNAMVRDVNSTQVSPTEQLADQAFLVDIA